MSSTVASFSETCMGSLACGPVPKHHRVKAKIDRGAWLCPCREKGSHGAKRGPEPECQPAFPRPSFGRCSTRWLLLLTAANSQKTAERPSLS